MENASKLDIWCHMGAVLRWNFLSTSVNYDPEEKNANHGIS